MTKKIGTPTVSPLNSAVVHAWAENPPKIAVWATTTHSAAIARSESMSGNRGWPGGGATAGGGATRAAPGRR